MSTTIYKHCPKCNLEHTKNGIFCSRKCSNSRGPRTEEFKNKVSLKLTGRTLIRNGKPVKGSFIIPRIKSSCYICSKEIIIKSNEIDLNHTCKSKKCLHTTYVEAGKSSASKRVRRSKKEIELFEICKSNFRDSLNNHIISNGWDADIVIPSLKYAIMWQGPWHYKEMNISNHSLLQVQNRDNIKRNLFTSLGWRVFEFKDCDYTPQTAFEKIMVESRGSAPLP